MISPPGNELLAANEVGIAGEDDTTAERTVEEVRVLLFQFFG